jgi:uncharacterized protein
MAGRLVQLAAGCAVLGFGVGLLLRAALGSDGYSTLINGISIASGVPYAFVNWTLGAALVAIAWGRGQRPGIGTIAQPLIVGTSVSATFSLVSAPDALALRGGLLVAALACMAFGVACYLDTATGSGPVEAAARACDPPVPFRWSYSVLQGAGALGGWALGAAIGPGTLLVVFGLGPIVDLLLRRAPPRSGRRSRRWSRPTRRGGS